jgi:hypothetical protein
MAANSIAWAQAASELDPANRFEPVSDLREIGLVHVEEVRHHGLHYRLAGVVRRHRYDPMENLERPSAPVLNRSVIATKTQLGRVRRR